MPSILMKMNERTMEFLKVLNLIITGMPSIRVQDKNKINLEVLSFKPYYNWNAFNTYLRKKLDHSMKQSFKPYYNWNAFNT